MMKKKILFCVVMLLVVTGCSTSKNSADTAWCKESIEKYNAIPKKQITQYEYINDESKRNNSIINVDKASNSLQRFTEANSLSATYIYHKEEGSWYCYGGVSEGEWYKTRIGDLEGQTLLETCDIVITDKSTFEEAVSEEVDGRETIKVKITTPLENNIAKEAENSGDITEKMLEDDNFKKAFEKAKAQSKEIKFVWFDSETKEPVKMEKDITESERFLFYYSQTFEDIQMSMKLAGYDEAPDKVVKVINFDGVTDEEIVIPEESEIIK